MDASANQSGSFPPSQTSQVTCATAEGASVRQKAATKDADKKELEGKMGEDDLEEWKQSLFGGKKTGYISVSH